MFLTEEEKHIIHYVASCRASRPSKGPILDVLNNDLELLEKQNVFYKTYKDLIEKLQRMDFMDFDNLITSIFFTFKNEELDNIQQDDREVNQLRDEYYDALDHFRKSKAELLDFLEFAINIPNLTALNLVLLWNRNPKLLKLYTMNEWINAKGRIVKSEYINYPYHVLLPIANPNKWKNSSNTKAPILMKDTKIYDISQTKINNLFILSDEESQDNKIEFDNDAPINEQEEVYEHIKKVIMSITNINYDFASLPPDEKFRNYTLFDNNVKINNNLPIEEKIYYIIRAVIQKRYMKEARIDVDHRELSEIEIDLISFIITVNLKFKFNSNDCPVSTRKLLETSPLDLNIIINNSLNYAHTLLNEIYIAYYNPTLSKKKYNSIEERYLAAAKEQQTGDKRE